MTITAANKISFGDYLAFGYLSKDGKTIKPRQGKVVPAAPGREKEGVICVKTEDEGFKSFTFAKMSDVKVLDTIDTYA